jgi:hypothetical protein
MRPSVIAEGVVWVYNSLWRGHGARTRPSWTDLWTRHTLPIAPCGAVDQRPGLIYRTEPLEQPQPESGALVLLD